jgi:hypothetical protein
MWARIQEGAVFELTDADPAKRFHESLVWQPVPASLASEIRQGWLWNGETFAAPPEAAPAVAPQPTLAQLRAELAALTAKIAAFAA